MFGVELPLLLTLCLVLVNAFFVATEFAIVKVRSAHIEDLARRGSPLARVARKVMGSRHLPGSSNPCSTSLAFGHRRWSTAFPLS